MIMKRVLSFCIGIVVSMSAFAQYMQDTTALSDPVSLRSKGCRIYAGAERLNKREAAAYFADMNGTDKSADYLRYRRAYHAGVGLTVTGSVVVGTGLGLTVVGGIVALVTLPFAALGGESTMPDELFVVPKIGAYTTLAGVVFWAAGIPTLCVYKKRIRTLVSDYNAQSSMQQSSPSKVELSFGGQPSGLGFALKF